MALVIFLHHSAKVPPLESFCRNISVPRSKALFLKRKLHVARPFRPQNHLSWISNPCPQTPWARSLGKSCDFHRKLRIQGSLDPRPGNEAWFPSCTRSGSRPIWAWVWAQKCPKTLRQVTLHTFPLGPIYPRGSEENAPIAIPARSFTRPEAGQVATFRPIQAEGRNTSQRVVFKVLLNLKFSGPP